MKKLIKVLCVTKSSSLGVVNQLPAAFKSISEWKEVHM